MKVKIYVRLSIPFCGNSKTLERLIPILFRLIILKLFLVDWNLLAEMSPNDCFT